MEDKLNIAEILKDAPKGTKLWSPVCGECELKEITKDAAYLITCLTKNCLGEWETVVFTNKGKYTNQFAKGECVLFPSKENRDWSTFKVPNKHKHLEPFQKILVKIWHDSRSIWIADFYSHYDEVTGRHYLVSGFTREDDDILPYKGNEDKLGKTVE